MARSCPRASTLMKLLLIVLLSILTGQGSEKIQDLSLLDVTPLSLGVGKDEEDCRDFMSVVIPRNTPIPVKMKQIITTAYDYQSVVSFPVYQGESSRVLDNHFLDEFVLSDCHAAPQGVIKFNVCFDIDVNGILNVTAEETSTGRKKQITITSNRRRRSKERIVRMIQEAEKLKAEDEDYKKKVEAKNALENYAFELGNAIKDEEISSMLSSADNKKLEDAIEKATRWLDDNQHAQVDEFRFNLIMLASVRYPIIVNMREGSVDAVNSEKYAMLLKLAKVISRSDKF